MVDYINAWRQRQLFNERLQRDLFPAAKEEVRNKQSAVLGYLDKVLDLYAAGKDIFVVDRDPQGLEDQIDALEIENAQLSNRCEALEREIVAVKAGGPVTPDEVIAAVAATEPASSTATELAASIEQESKTRRKTKNEGS